MRSGLFPTMSDKEGVISGLMKDLHGPIYRERLRVLSSRIVEHLRASDAVLDVGCGNGLLGHTIWKHPRCPSGVTVEGLERAPRGAEPIRVHRYDGLVMPLADASYDVVIVADVLHHEHDPDRLMRECVRVAKRCVIVKDHQVSGVLARQRISLMDWAANAPHGVPCLYRYLTPEQWDDFPGRFGLRAREELRSMNIYPRFWNMLFGGRLHYFGVLEKQHAEQPVSIKP
jgi:SAM-dependent methyltransferase